jgi:hypothetical protein
MLAQTAPKMLVSHTPLNIFGNRIPVSRTHARASRRRFKCSPAVNASRDKVSRESLTTLCGTCSDDTEDTLTPPRLQEGGGGGRIHRRAALMGVAALQWQWVAPAPVALPAWAAPVTVPVTIPSWTLEGGVQMPTLALNTAGLSADDTTRAVCALHFM